MRCGIIILVALCSVFPVATAGGKPDTSIAVQTVIRPVFDNRVQKFPALVPFQDVRLPRVALVLSGGGARGVASVGVIKALEKHRFPVDLIVGTSIGGIVGGLYASGYSPGDLERLVDTTNWVDVLSYSNEARREEMFLEQRIAKEQSMLVLRFKGLEPVIPSSYSSGQRLTNYLNILALQGIYHPNPSFNDLRIPYRAVTTDLVSGRQYVFDSGDLSQAMRASVAVPLLFSPVIRDSMLLLDGGLLSNMPVDVARANGADIVLTVDVTSPLRPPTMLDAPWEIGEQIMGVMMQKPNEEARRKSDFVLQPALGGHLSTDFTGLDQLVQLGESAVDSSIDKLRRLLAEKTDQWFFARSNRTYSNIEFNGDLSSLIPEFRTRVQLLGQRPSIRSGELEHLVTDLYHEGDHAAVEAVVTEFRDRTVITLRLQEYPVLNTVEFVGARVIPRDSLIAKFRPLIGLRINAQEVQRALELILSEYREAGFSLMRIRDIRFDTTSGHASITLDEGTIYRMEVHGTTKTRDYLVWRELPFDEGDVFQMSKVIRGLNNLFGTGLFDQMSLSVMQEGSNNEHQILLFNAQERNTELIRFGLRVDNERSIQPSVDIRDENFLGNGFEVGLRFNGGPRNQSYMAEFKVIRIFNSYLTFSLKGYSHTRDVNVFQSDPAPDPLHYARTRIGEYREFKEGGSAAFGTQLERLGSFTVEGRVEHHRILNLFNTPVTEGGYNISSIKFGTRLENLDKYPFPTAGVIMDLSYETALYNVGDAIGFTKLIFSYETYQTLGTKHTVHPKVMIGVGDEAVPLAEQFSFGGQYSFFGLREDDSRGSQVILASLEYRYKVPFRVFFDSFIGFRYDLGSIWSRPEQIRLIDLQHGVGLTLGFDTPIGPAQFGVGRSFRQLKQFLDKPVALGPTTGYFSIGYRLN